MLLAAEETAHAAGWFLENAWLIPLIPFVAFFVILLLGKRMPRGGSEVGIASMVAALVIAAGAAFQWIDRVDAGHGEEIEPVVKQWTWWQSGGIEFGIGEHIDGLAVMALAAGRVHLDAGADLLDRIRQGRSPVHALLRQHHAVLGRHADHGAGPQHGPADPRLGDHGPHVVPADRALVGRDGQQRGRPQGVLDRPRRRRRPAGRHGDAARHLRHARHQGHQRGGSGRRVRQPERV